jgi:hypothetical protein
MPFSTSSAFAPAARRQAHQDTNIPQIVVRFGRHGYIVRYRILPPEQIVVRFGRHGYIVRYRILPPDNTIFVTRIWHGREARE